MIASNLELRAIMTHHEPTVAVVGAGFTGTIVTLHLNRKLPPGHGIVLCERGGTAGPGVAYGTGHPDHLLNVRAANMSAFASEPAHFASWLKGAATETPCHVHETEVGTFASRGLYGQYLASMLSQAVAATARITLAPEVVDLVPQDGGWRLVSRDGSSRPAAAVVLAIGNLPATADDNAVTCAHPWADGATAGLRPGEPVLIIGSGLTAVDLMVEIRERGFAGPVIAISRRGLLPNRHAVSAAWPTPSLSADERRSLLALLVRLRREVAAARAVGVDWRGVIDSMRPVTADLWRGLPERERARFLRHLRPFWDVHRHRMAIPVAALLGDMLASGFLRVRRGRVLATAETGGCADVTWQPRGSGTAERMTVQRVINATGVVAAARSSDPLVRNLQRRGLIRLDRYGLGLDVTDTLQVLDAAGRAAPTLWALGPIVRGVFWECTAVPDIRTQAERVGQYVAEIMRGPARSLAALSS